MNSLENLIRHTECRCCLSQGNHRDLFKEYYVNGQREVFMDVITGCFNLFLSADSRLSTRICTMCIKKLRDAHSFRTQVLKNEKMQLDALSHDNTEFVNVAFDPLSEDAEIKSETKSNILEFSDSDELDFNTVRISDRVSDLKTVDSEEMIPGEKELLQRFPEVKLLPTRDSLIDICPIYDGHLESLKDKVIKAKTMSKLYNSWKPVKHKTLPRKKTKNMMTEKIALALNSITILENSNATVFKSKMRSGFPCFYCRTIFDSPKELRCHQKDHPKNKLFKLLTKYTSDELLVYADVTDLKCTICNEDMKSILDLKEHLVKVHNKKIYTDVLDRVIPFKLGDKQSHYDCQICELNFETFGAINKHMNSHYKNYVCEECGAGFITKHRLKVHLNLLHKKSNLIVCECKKTFLNSHKYKIHVENAHKKLKKMRCVKCSEKFIDYFTRQRHMEEKHGVEPILYKCTECNKSFNRKYTLTCHIKRKHLFSKDVQCDLCPFMCYNKSELKDHMFKHTEGKTFECVICKKMYSRKKALTFHMREHSNERRYSCHLCGEAFVRNWSLKSHLKSHDIVDT